MMSRILHRSTALVAAALAGPVLAGLTGTTAPAAGAATAAPTSGPDTVLVSVAADGGPANGEADRPQISGNGRYVTFDSNATNLVAGIPYKERRVYRRDLQTGVTDVVSATSAGSPAAGWSSFSWPSDDGNLVAFVSDDQALATPTAVARAIYLRNMTTGATELVSISPTGRSANGASSRPMLSSTGRYVAFSSYATNLTSEGNNGQEQVYLRDRVTGTTSLVSTALGGGVGNQRSYRGMVSADGRYVAFASFATNLTSGTNPSAESIFIRDMVAGTTRRVTVRANGQPAPLGGSRPYFSPDGRHVVFNTYDPLVPSDTDTRGDVYVYDVQTGAMERQTVTPSGAGSNGDSLRGFVTDNGATSVFNSFASNLTDTDKNASGDVFARDRATGLNKMLSVSWFEGPADGQSYRPVTSDDGAVVAYLSEARNLVRDDRSTTWQVYAVSPASVSGVADSVPASATVTAPTQGSTVPAPVTLRGTASDDRSVAAVHVQVRDNGSGLWLRPDGTWGSGAVRIPTRLESPYAATTGWSLPVSLQPGAYGFEVIALDAAGNVPSTRPWTGFKVGTADTTAPTIALGGPSGGAYVTSPATLSGTAGDDLGVDRVFVQVRDNGTGLWLRPDGTWATGAARLPVTLASPGATSTAWSTTLNLADGSYFYDAVALDAASNASTRPSASFRVGTPDTTAPTVAVTAPVQGSTVPAPVTLEGTAADDRGVDKVFVQVRDNGSGLWLRADGTWASGAARIPVTVAGAGTSSATWSYQPALSAGSYGFDVVALDAAGNSSTRPWTGFRVAASGG